MKLTPKSKHMQSAGICTCQSRFSHQSSSASLSLLTTYVAVQCVRYLTTTRVTTLSHSADPALLISIARLFSLFPVVSFCVYWSRVPVSGAHQQCLTFIIPSMAYRVTVLLTSVGCSHVCCISLLFSQAIDTVCLRATLLFSTPRSRRSSSA